MHCVRHITTALFVLCHAQAMQLKANSSTSYGPSWLRVVFPQGGATCAWVDDCLVGSGLGSCFVSVDASNVPHPLSSTDTGNDVDFVNTLDGTVQPLQAHYMYPPESFDKAVYSMVVLGKTVSSHWNLCLTPPWITPARRDTDRQELQVTGAEDYCYYVNGLCWLWASPCAGASWCSQMNAHSTYDWFCPGGLRYSTQAEFNAAYPTLNATKPAFHAKCAASPLDPVHNHCDLVNDLVRVEDNSHMELILICDPNPTSPPTPYPTPFPTPYPTPYPTPSPTLSPTMQHPTMPAGPMAGGAGGVAATGDPHLQNVYGERFDLMRPGKHILIQIPREQPVENAVLRVEADAVQMGVQCTDMYFQELNITGAWVEAKRTGGFYFNARDGAHGETPQWERFGKVDVKVAHGRTEEGTRYLNFYVKHLANAGYAVGGLLGEDDHTEAVTPSGACVRRRLTLLQMNR